MRFRLDRVHVWAGEVEDRPGGVAAKLSALAEADANLAFVFTQRRPDKPGNVLTIETWVAPGLQYLPVRLRINQDAETYLELVIERKPQQSDK